MYNISTPRRAFLGALVALALAAGALCVTTSKAAAACPGNSVCIYENANLTGNSSVWSAGETGCHNHERNPRILSGVNNTGGWVRFGTLRVPPGVGFGQRAEANPITGEICWPIMP
jgi:hypothetical protein